MRILFALILASSLPLAVARGDATTPTKAPPPGDKKSDHTCTLVVNAAGELRLDDETAGDDDVRGRLAVRHKADPELRVVIAADGDTRHAVVVHAIDLVKQAGVTRIAIAVRPGAK